MLISKNKQILRKVNNNNSGNINSKGQHQSEKQQQQRTTSTACLQAYCLSSLALFNPSFVFDGQNYVTGIRTRGGSNVNCL